MCGDCVHVAPAALHCAGPVTGMCAVGAEEPLYGGDQEVHGERGIPVVAGDAERGHGFLVGPPGRLGHQQPGSVDLGTEQLSSLDIWSHCAPIRLAGYEEDLAERTYCPESTERGSGALRTVRAMPREMGCRHTGRDTVGPGQASLTGADEDQESGMRSRLRLWEAVGLGFEPRRRLPKARFRGSKARIPSCPAASVDPATRGRRRSGSRRRPGGPIRPACPSEWTFPASVDSADPNAGCRLGVFKVSNNDRDIAHLCVEEADGERRT